MATETMTTTPGTAQGNFWSDNTDLQFYLKKAIDWAAFVPDLERGFTEPEGFKSLQEALDFYEETLKLVGDFAGNEIAARAHEVDQAQVRYEDGEAILSPGMVENLEKAKQLGVLTPDLPREIGGWNLPLTITGMSVEMIARACPATMVQYGFFEAPARLLHIFGDDFLKKTYLEKLCKGELSGSICITESDAGSDVGRIKCAATRQGDAWRVTGRKQFISNGGGEVAIVVCRTDPKSSGLNGLSLLVVPRHVERDGKQVRNFEVARVEHKLCIRGSATCELAFEDSVGYLLGTEGKGFDHVLHFMNEGRTAVGIQCLGVMEASYRTALRFARDRVTMGKPIWRHELVADMLAEMETEALALRAALMSAYESQDRIAALERRAAKAAPGSAEAADLASQKKRIEHHVRLLTPLVKFYGAERCIDAARKGLQIHGGYGVIVDYDAERFHRDAPIFAIYEGTSQIQSLMSLKDTLKSLRGPRTLKEIASLWLTKTFAGDPLERMLAEAEYLWKRSLLHHGRAINRELAKVQGAPGMSMKDRFNILLEARDGFNALSWAFLRAERLCWLASIAVFGRILVEQTKRFPERRAIAERYLTRRLPEARMHADVVLSKDRSTFDWIKAQQTASVESRP